MFMVNKTSSETGDGPVDAIFKCIKNLYPHDVNLTRQVHAVTEGTDAQATVSVKLKKMEKQQLVKLDTDTLVASANAHKCFK